VVWGRDKQNIVFSTGKSILNKTSNTNVGELMLKYGGGGHMAAGGCQPSIDEAESVLKEIIKQITNDG
jgi:nanoRNase/pAp phosphatase (c-di-AMP/oligoRNAs hydrolase)